MVIYLITSIRIQQLIISKNKKKIYQIFKKFLSYIYNIKLYIASRHMQINSNIIIPKIYKIKLQYKNTLKYIYIIQLCNYDITINLSYKKYYHN